MESNSTKVPKEVTFGDSDDLSIGVKGSPKSAMRLTKINGKRIFVK